MKRIFLLIIFVSLFLLCGCSDCNGCNKAQPNSYEINFIIDGEQYLSDTVVYGKTIEKPVTEEKQGYVFKGWYVTEDYVEEWNFAEPVYNSVTLYAYWVEVEKETFNVVYKDDDVIVHTDKVFKGSCTEKFTPEEKEGYTFSGWMYNGQAYDFSTPIYSDITLTAVWIAIEYKITFIADGQVVAEEYFTANNLLVAIPDLPEKEHYTGKWETFTYELKNIEVQAVYTPTPYNATFYVDNEIYLEFTYTVEDEIEIPEVPSKAGYTGLWSGLPITGGNVTINAVYTPIDYTITYKINGEIVDTRTYNAEYKDVTPPDIPEIPGYEGHWDDVVLDIGDITVNAYYSLKELRAYFYVDEELYASRTFTAENKNIDVPDVPIKEGYTCSWENYELGYEDVIINAIYIKDAYTATFKIDDRIIDTVEFTIDTTAIKEPTIPEQYQKKGYTAQWEKYTLGTQDITVNVEYVPIIYSAEFVIDGQVIDSSEFTFEDETLTEPTIPDEFQKDGYTVTWEQYTLEGEDISIKAIYTPITYTARFIVDNQIIYETQFTVEDTYIDEPEIANRYQKKGYAAQWENYSIIADDLVINIEYKLITYYASFVYENTVIEKVPYTINDKIIKEPTPPQRDGYIGVWDDYVIPYEDFEINLRYFEIKQNETVGYLQFTLLENNTYSLTNYSNTSEISESVIEIPAEVNHIPVSTIAERAFAYKKNFDEIIIPDSITEIGAYAFTHTNIRTIKLPSSLLQIESIFVSCKNLKNVTISSGTKRIQSYAFSGCTSLTEINIPTSIEYIDANAFHECSSLNRVIFENCDNWHIFSDANHQQEIKNDSAIINLTANLSNSATAAKYLTSEYHKYYWKKEI